MVLLWGMQYCQLKAWSYAASIAKDKQVDEDGGALRKGFIRHWTSRKFVNITDRMGDAMDEVWQEMGEGDLSLGEKAPEGGWSRCTGRYQMKLRVEEIWRNILDVQEKLWSEVWEVGWEQDAEGEN
ncbi:uncharacterized protein PAC_10950 [Phialocephala subalpina]|uniref:Uncharacterized protein n=1 Tax=Phialocephala subalpina TaxID=576137 RepID=A0A1L7X7Q8_9HELO|nr:uncharacterized protein PAC_10950 [Phialocephala subalpina]